MISVVAKNFVKDNHLEAVQALYQALAEATRLEEGCIQYELHQDVNEPLNLVMLETWVSREALDQHLNSEHFLRLVPEIRQHMAKPGEMTILSKLI